MCGRFTLTKPVRAVAELFRLPEPPSELAPRYNVAPSQTVAVVGARPDGTSRKLAMLRWGLVPSWANSPNEGFRPINARSDSLDKPTFRDAFRGSRCLIPADGFYEWKTEGAGKKARKTPYHFRFTDGRLFAFAGLWDHWTDGTTGVATCCLITVAANEVVAPFHDRMPAILAPDEYGRWLDHANPLPVLRALLRPFPPADMEAVAVSPLVNKPANDGPECLAPAA